jgi:hypothetical protein
MSGYPDEVSVVAVDKDHVLATFRHVVVCVWLKETRASAVDAASDKLAELASSFGHRVAIIQVVERGAGNLNRDTRAALAALLKRGRDYIRASAVVYDGEGFRSAAVRMIVSGLVQLNNPGFAHQVFADVPSAAKLVADKTASSLSEAVRLTDGIVTCVAKIRQGAKETLASSPDQPSLRVGRL